MRSSTHRATRAGRRRKAQSFRQEIAPLVRVLGLWALGCFSACSTSIQERPEGGSGDSTPTSGNASSPGGGSALGAGNGSGASSGAGPGSGGNGTGGSGTAGTGAVGGKGPGLDGPASLLPARIRRLANAEYDASVQALLGTQASPASGSDFPPDFRQNGFTVNEAQRVDSIIVQRLASAAEALADEAKQNGTLTRLAPCADMGQAQGCARAFITSFGAKVYRRPLDEDEVVGLVDLYTVGAEGATYLDGVAHVVRGLLQSAGFLYLTELGNGTSGPDGAIPLTPHELAASLSYFLTSGPPDEALLDKAVKGALADPAVREDEARRLLKENSLAQDSAVRLVREWLGIDRIRSSSKDSMVYPKYDALKSKIDAESRDFVRAVAFRSTGTVSELLGAKWTASSGPLELYKPGGSGPLSDSTELTDRIGILNQAAFLATYANAHESHPVLRGVAVSRRLACLDVPSPTVLNIRVVPPVPDKQKTTRKRFEIHSTDPECVQCHTIIDPFGFAFEQFDGMGAYRSVENNDPNQPVDSAVTIAAGIDIDGAYPDSNALATALSESEEVRACFARFMFRAASASSDAALRPTEDAFVEAWRAIPAAAQGNIVETLVAYVKSPSFSARRAQ